jgi:hypothetical protein
MQGEVDALRWLNTVAKAPVPKVTSKIFGENELTHNLPSHGRADDVGDGETDFYFIECIPGRPYDWDFHLNIPLQQLQNTVKGYAEYMIRISNQPLQGVGSLYHDATSDTYTVGPHICHGIFEDDAPYFAGPFETTGQKWASLCDCLLGAIRAGTLHGQTTVKSFCFFRWLRDAVLSYPPFNEKGEATYLVHEDSKPDIIMAGEAGIVTGILDWDW